ncbi:MAG: hypothetical protein JWP97_2866 [Labilithrix sp.]|nr:hypothetical protein [Labilithrix sp.]
MRGHARVWITADLGEKQPVAELSRYVTLRSMPARNRHVRSSRLLLGAALLGGAFWIGCATDNGDPVDDGEVVAPAPGKKAGSDAATDAGDRPAFEAGFEDSGTEDPTPDGGDVCVDNNDPGSSETTAKALPGTNDSQNDPLSVSGTLSSSVDVDFYKIQVDDTSFHLLQPAMEIKTSGVEMCVFVKCPSGSTSSVTCQDGAVAKKSDIGTDGCCATGPSSGHPEWNCSGANDSAALFIRIKQTANACLPYTFTYAF